MSPEPTLPIVAIVGRPNVGKSTLFNRYAGHRRALVANEPGVTRDRIAEEVEAAGRRVLLVDTAGLDADPAGSLAAAVQGQARAAVAEADAILFVVDGRSGRIPADEELAGILRRTRKPVAVAVNKIDTPAHEDRTAEFHAFGLEPVRGVSAEHGRGAWDLLEELVAALPAREGAAQTAPAGAGPDGSLRIAIAGRPNVGKSSLLNRLVGRERVVVSEVPGTTRDAVDVRIEDDSGSVVFVDTAGLRRPGRRSEHTERGSALMTVRAVERAQLALVVTDASEGFTEQDVRVVSLVRRRGRAAVVLLNKWDKVDEQGEGTAAALRSQVDRRLRWLPDATVLAISALTGRGVGRILPAARRLAEASARTIPTAVLNRWLQDATRRHEPAMAQRGSRKRPVKFFYATQVGTGPPSFALFCSDPTAVQESYRRFLTNRLREDFELEGIPIRLQLRPRRAEAEA
jgi:GTP-binding protein